MNTNGKRPVLNKRLIKELLELKPDVEEQRKYEKHTIQSSNIFARIAHRDRTIKGIKYVSEEIQSGKLLDYGCGTGVFVYILNKLKNEAAIGYEPYQKGRFREDTPIFSEFSSVLKYKPFKIITIFEVIEHLSKKNIDEFLSRSEELLEEDGVILISVPIEIGLGLILKEINHIKNGRKREYKFLEFIKAAFWGKPGERIGDESRGYGPHKGFDFRELLRYITA